MAAKEDTNQIREVFAEYVKFTMILKICWNHMYGLNVCLHRPDKISNFADLKNRFRKNSYGMRSHPPQLFAVFFNPNIIRFLEDICICYEVLVATHFMHS